MNKYKKIFNGLGLLSITTLIGTSVVAYVQIINQVQKTLNQH
ncbi:hypothetical protein NW741_02890 [Mycoplasmopsis cynos]|nr:hypothetical protein [Mycoplasmopsis cynos]MCU9935276.1 hypothetical protein [Mycoplasmopsis cynos]